MTKTDLARLWREVNGGNRWPSDVDAFVEALLKQPRCTVPPTGWTCTRKAGHSGPCAAVEQYLSLCDAMGYKAGEQELSPEEFASKLAQQAATVKESLIPQQAQQAQGVPVGEIAVAATSSKGALARFYPSAANLMPGTQLYAAAPQADQQSSEGGTLEDIGTKGAAT